MKRFRWISGHLVSLAMASAGASCGHSPPAPAGEVKAACEPMGPEGYEYVRTSSRLTDAAFAKLDVDLGIIARVIEQRVFGPDDKDWIGDQWLPRGCVPRELLVQVALQGADPAAVEAVQTAGLENIVGTVRPGAAETFLSGRISPSRLVDLALVQAVTEIVTPRPMIPELNKSAPYIRVPALQSAHPEASGKDVVIAVLDSGIDWRHGTFRSVDGRTRILGIWDRFLEARPGEVAGPAGHGVVYTSADINHSLGYAPVDPYPFTG